MNVYSSTILYSDYLVWLEIYVLVAGVIEVSISGMGIIDVLIKFFTTLFEFNGS